MHELASGMPYVTVESGPRGNPVYEVGGTSRIGELTRQELAEIVQDAWLSRASNRRKATGLAAHQAAGTSP